MDTKRQTFPDFMRTTVLEPLAMNHSTYGQCTTNGEFKG
jgi:CubicO group peptidase (beta-lactamase class C family)